MVTRSLKTVISKALVQVFWTCCWNNNKSILILFIKRKRSKLRNKCCRGSGAKSSNSGTGPRTTGTSWTWSLFWKKKRKKERAGAVKLRQSDAKAGPGFCFLQSTFICSSGLTDAAACSKWRLFIKMATDWQVSEVGDTCRPAAGPRSRRSVNFCRNCASRVSRALECPPLAFAWNKYTLAYTSETSQSILLIKLWKYSV